DFNVLIGETKEDQRLSSLDTFSREPNIKLLLTTMQTGGLGLNMTAASIAIFMDEHWSPGINKQATDRLHRIGQDRSVTIYRFVCQRTIEEDVAKLLRLKEKLFEDMITV